MNRLRSLLLGAAALAAYAVHSLTHIRIGTPEGMLWMCNVAVLLVGAGLLFAQRRLVAIGFCWLVVGDVAWATDLATGGSLLPTSLLTHVVGLCLAIAALRDIGFAPWTWPLAGLAVIALQEVTRLVAPASTNVNVAFAMFPGSDRLFSSYGVYRASSLALAFLAFAVVELCARRLFPEPRGEPPAAAVNSPGQQAGDPQD